MKLGTKIISVISALALSLTASAAGLCGAFSTTAAQPDDISSSMEWGAVEIGGGGFVSGIVTGKNEMYARTDVGGAYKYNYETEEWEQLFSFINEADKGFLSVDAMAVDPTDDDTVYFLCGCAYFSGARTAVFRTRDGGKTFDEIDITDMIQVHGNGYGRQCGESIAVDPDNPDIIYCGGDVNSGESALIWSQDGGDTWEPVKGYDSLGYFKYTVNWPWWDTHPVKAATTDGEQDYAQQNGVSSIIINDGKVYVATSVVGETNVVVADVGSDDFTELSSELPTNWYPSRLIPDGDGNLFITYLDSITLGKVLGGIYKYNFKTGEVTDISPSGEGYSGISADPENPKRLIAATCANSPMSQLWYEGAWDDGNVAWGERFFRSTDGGENWEEITPGNTKGWGQPLQADYLQDGGRSWIRNKAIHWAGSAVIDPRDTDRYFVTSGNGVFMCEDTWGELPRYTFHPDGIEEVVALDMVSIPGRNNFSAIGDYDGFEHADIKVSGKQYQPNMGSTIAIAYCPQNPDVMIRIAENQNDIAPGFYTLDGGETWTKMNNSSGGKAAITQLEDGSYRFFKSNKDDGCVSYSDDLGQTWNDCTGIPSTYGSKSTFMLVEPDQPNVVYAYATYYNSSWFYSKDEPDFSDAHYTLCVSTDYGKTFTSTDIAMYDQCDSAARIAYLGEDNLILGAGYYGMYNVTDGGKTVNKLDSVFYCKTVGYGAPEKEGDVNTLFMYGKPDETDPEGIYRSQDGGKTWVCINTDKLYGGTGNGNFLVGDMNEFGTVYMSTVGCGIVYGKLSDEPVIPGTTTTKAVTTSKTTQTTVTTTVVTEVPTDTPTVSGTVDPDKMMYGDVDCNGSVEIADVVTLNKYILDNSTSVTAQGLANADCEYNQKVEMSDSAKIVNFLAKIITEDQLGPEK
ncbi:MAG: dockerin type I domain-containing protein [Porcipelethomonas sp.]